MFVTNASRMILKVINFLAWLAQAVFAAMLVSLLTGLETHATLHVALQGLFKGPGIPSATLPELEATYQHVFELVLAAGIAVGAAVHIVCSRTVAVIDTLKAGTPFIAINAKRLREVGWALLAVQFIGIAMRVLVHELTVTTGRQLERAPDFADGWLAVLLVFVLARVFAHGTAMQDEIEGTV